MTAGVEDPGPASALPSLDVLWHEDRPDYPPGEVPASVDVAVIGAGITGTAVALNLQRLGVSTVVVERRFPAWGASGRNAGHLVAGTLEHYSRAVEALGHGRARDLWEFSVRSCDELRAEIGLLPADVAFQQTGFLACAATPEERRELERSVQLLRDDGFKAEFWSSEQLGKRFGHSAFHGARYCPDGALVHPGRLVWALIRRYLEEGGRLLCATEARGVEDRADGLLLQTDRGAIRCTAVVHCTNAWTFELLPGFRERIQPVRGQMLATERLHKVFSMGMAANFGYEYWRQADRGAVLLGGWRWSQAEREIGVLGEELNPEVHRGLVEFMRASFPRLKDIEVKRAWTGLMGFSSDGTPWIGEVPGRQGQFLAAGFTGHGFAMAWRGACLLAREIVRGRHDRELDWFSTRR